MSVIPKILRASGGLCPLGPLPRLYPGPAGDLKRSTDPSPTHAPPPQPPILDPPLTMYWYCYSQQRQALSEINLDETVTLNIYFIVIQNKTNG